MKLLYEFINAILGILQFCWQSFMCLFLDEIMQDAVEKR